MHASLHTLAHRAPPATRTRVRWQPYSSISSTTSSFSKSPASQISTPASSISSPISNTPHPDPSRIKLLPTQTQNKDQPPKIKHAIGLVDQAVKTLSEIWRPQDVPSAFLYSSKAGLTASGSLETIDHPSSSSNRMTGCTPLSISQPNDVPGNLVPIKGFVHEVIRRSRTSGCVLQTALCYVEAIRSQVPGLVRKEQSGQSTHTERDISTRIMPASESDLEFDQYLCMEAENRADQAETSADAFLVPTVRINDIEESSSFPSDSSLSNGISEQLTAPTPILPSPLLCPRRTFLAALILASKFTQDKCYSNRAWAKLSGLPAREIGRCERTLGEALEWRLWVGKTTVPSQATATPNNTSNRPIVRSQSENNILSSPTRSSFLVRPSDVVQPVIPANGQKLRRCSTMPVEEFAFAKSSCGFELPAEIQQFISARLKCNQSSPDDIQITPLGTTMQASYLEVLCQSPSPENPGLSYSPSSTESSSGDRTIQMNTFIDEPMSSYSGSQGATVETWPWSDVNDAQDGFKISPTTSFTANSMIKVMGPNEYSNLLSCQSQEMGTGHLVRNSNMNISWDPEGETIRLLALSAA